MKLNDLIEALASEIESAGPQLKRSLDQLTFLAVDNESFMDALDQYSGQAQRMGEATSMVGFPGLEAVCAHVTENALLLATLSPDDRAPVLEFLREWTPLILHYLRNLSDPSSAAGLVDHLRTAPSPMEEDQALKVMHMLGAIPAQVAMLGGHGSSPQRPVLARLEDVALSIPDDVDRQLFEGFIQEAPEQARYLVSLSKNLASGQGDESDLVAAKRVVHTLKGSGAIMGLRGMATLAHHFEDILEHFERLGSRVAPAAVHTLLDAAYCLDQMVGFAVGDDDYPQQSQAVLQAVLDLANRIDRGDSLDEPVARTSAMTTVNAATEVATQEYRPASSQEATEATSLGSTRSPSAALRVSVERIEELFRVSGEISVHSAAMEARIKALADHSHDLLSQNLRLQKRLFELETVVDVRALTLMRARTQRTEDAAFDPLEMEQYSELHGTAHALFEDAADARTLALKLEENITQVSGVHTRQQRLSKELQHLLSNTRMSQVGVLESRLQRNVRSTCQVTGKQATLELLGGDTLIDSDVLNRLAEPLMHVLRNAVDHGLESPQERLVLGKNAEGRITLTFKRRGQQVVLKCQDDGRGLDLSAIRLRAVERGILDADQTMSDEELMRLVLAPGFSTRDDVSELSGRGIGLDVVREWSQTMNGAIKIESQPGVGCSIELNFSASMSTMHALVVEVGGQRFSLPSVQVEQAVPPGVGAFESLGDHLVYRLEKRVYPALLLAEIAAIAADKKPIQEHCAVILNIDNAKYAIAVEKLLDARDLLVKSPGRYAKHMRGVAGLSILGDGGIAVNLDPAELILKGIPKDISHSIPTVASQQEHKSVPGVLIVDDALSVRNSLMQLMLDSGFRAEAARDGIDAINTLRSFRPDVVLTDLEMPNMNGIELATHIRNREDLKGMPVFMITSRSQEKHRRLAEQAGVDKYFTKPYNDGELLQMIRLAIAA